MSQNTFDTFYAQVVQLEKQIRTIGALPSIERDLLTERLRAIYALLVALPTTDEPSDAAASQHTQPATTMTPCVEKTATDDSQAKESDKKNRRHKDSKPQTNQEIASVFAPPEADSDPIVVSPITITDDETTPDPFIESLLSEATKESSTTTTELTPNSTTQPTESTKEKNITIDTSQWGFDPNGPSAQNKQVPPDPMSETITAQQPTEPLTDNTNSQQLELDSRISQLENLSNTVARQTPTTPTPPSTDEVSLLDLLPKNANNEATLGEILRPSKSGQGNLANTKKVTDLRTIINVNDKFSFMALFGNNMKAYNDFILRLNAINDREEALDHVREIAAEYEWDMESLSVKTFFEIFDRKF
ncbi:MAG: hypothetical protein KBT04_08040 [Bacteroidales bacterium]|nr:hypothetical protein [Candidatus Colimorpha onthohippi]